MLSHIAGLIYSNLTVIAPLRGGAGLTWQAISTIVPAYYGNVIVLSRPIAIFDLSVERRRTNHRGSICGQIKELLGFDLTAWE